MIQNCSKKCRERSSDWRIRWEKNQSQYEYSTRISECHENEQYYHNFLFLIIWNYILYFNYSLLCSNSYL